MFCKIWVLLVLAAGVQSLDMNHLRIAIHPKASTPFVPKSLSYIRLSCFIHWGKDEARGKMVGSGIALDQSGCPRTSLSVPPLCFPPPHPIRECR